MITVIREKPEPRKRVTCSNCGSELEYGNADLYKEEGPLPVGYALIHSFYFYCPVCRCKEYADWITQDTNGENTHSQNFEIIYDFPDGLARVKLHGKGYNFINKEGKTISPQWFDVAWDFNQGFAMIFHNNKYYFLNTKGQLCDYETKEVLKEEKL